MPQRKKQSYTTDLIKKYNFRVEFTAMKLSKKCDLCQHFFDIFLHFYMIIFYNYD